MNPRRAFLPLLLLIAWVSSSGVEAQSVPENDPFILLFESSQGFGLPAILDSATVRFRDRNDPNGDGRVDLTLLREDGTGTPIEVVTVDVVNQQELWSVSVSSIAEALGTDQFRFQGYFSFNSDRDAVWALFRGRNGNSAMWSPTMSEEDLVVFPAERLATLDLDGDGAVELIIQNSETQTVQIWGGSRTSTAAQEAIEAAMLRLFQNYPNPFQERTTIAYFLREPGPVRITVYDLLGRLVRTLVDEEQPPGSFEVGWDGQDAAGLPVASGTYIYRMTAGDTSASRRALRIE